MSFCNACGTKNPADARFCSACGHALQVVTVEPVEVPIAQPVAQPTAQPNAQPAAQTLASATSAPAPRSAAQDVVPPVRLKAFDNPAELWKMYFYVSFFNVGAYFLTNAAAEFLQESGGLLSIPMGIFTVFILSFFGLAYWLIKKQAVDKNRSLWLLPLIAWQVYAYLDGLSGFDPMYAESSFDYYDAYISGVPETLILIRLFVALRERMGNH